MRGCSGLDGKGDGVNLERGEFEASVGHQPSRGTEIIHMRLKKRAERKRRARVQRKRSRGWFQGKERKYFKIGVLNHFKNTKIPLWNLVDAGAEVSGEV